jgi:trehalose/maltose hydrolase-like predicted phosphorylase
MLGLEYWDYHLVPCLPKHWKRIRFCFWHHGQQAEVVVENQYRPEQKES